MAVGHESTIAVNEFYKRHLYLESEQVTSVHAYGH